jgi:hypothetical protein
MEEELYSRTENFDDVDESNPQSVNDLNALQKILQILKPFDKNSVRKIIKTVLTFYGFELAQGFGNDFRKESYRNKESKFSENRDITPKDFMMEKVPQTDVDKIACLAYYITHYRNQEEFKALDLSKLNTEAAQLKFANITVALDHATRTYGFLVPTKKGYKKLSAIGELYVQALPDKDEAKSVIAKSKPRRKSKKNKSQKRF